MKKRFLSMALSLVMLFQLLPMGTGAVKAAADEAAERKAEVTRLYRENILGSEGFEVTTYTETPYAKSPYKLGAVSEESQIYALDSLNYIRALAGLNPVVRNEEYTDLAQHGAVLCDAIGYISHFPPQPEDMEDDFFAPGAKATANSNLSSGYATMAEALRGQLDDKSSAANMLALGHRRWLLNPSFGETGFGISDRYYDVYVLDRSGEAPDYDLITWPAQDAQPLEYFSADTPWSVTLRPERYLPPDPAKISVKLTRESDGMEWTFDQGDETQEPTKDKPYFTVNKEMFGVNNCIIFYPGLETLDQEGLHGGFRVEISGLTTIYGEEVIASYRTDFFEMEAVVNFYSNGGSPVGRQTLFYGEYVKKPGNPTQAGKTFLGWYSDSECTVPFDFGSPVGGSMGLFAKWGDGDETFCTVSFETNGGPAITEQKLAAGELPHRPEDPVREGYVFEGWYADAAGLIPFSFEEAVTADVKVYAKWTQEEIELPVYYQVTFESNGGSDVAALEAEADSTIAAPADPVRAGYDFVGWYRDGALTSPWNFERDLVTEDLQLFAKWTQQETENPDPGVETYVVWFETNGGTEVMSQGVEAGEPVMIPEETRREGFVFGGWFADEGFTTPWNFETDTIHEDTTLYAKWYKGEIPPEGSYQVSFNSNGGSEVAPVVVEAGGLVPTPADPVREGYQFQGWWDHDFYVYWDFAADTVHGDMTLYAKWRALPAVPVQYTVRFDSKGGSAVADQTVDAGKKLVKPQDPTLAGQVFEGWYKDSEGEDPWDFAKDVVTKDSVLYAKWREAAVPQSHTIHFDSNGGSDVADQVVPAGKPVSRPADPTKEGYLFEGWYKDSEGETPWDFQKDLPEEDLTLYAKWTEEQVTPGKPQLDRTSRKAYVSGYEDGTVLPMNKMPRQEAAALFMKLMSEETLAAYRTTEHSFNDVSDANWGQEAIATLANAGVINGYEDGGFHPNALLTRGELVTMVCKFFEVTASDRVFTDTKDHWAKAFIGFAADQGWVKGYEPGGEFRPDNSLTRAEAFVIFNAVTGRSTEDLAKLQNMKTFSDNQDPSVWFYAHIQIATNDY